MLKWIALVPLSIVLALSILWVSQRRMIYIPSSIVPSPTTMGLSRAQEVTFATDDGLTLHGWYVPAASEPARFTTIVFNGNAGNRAARASLAQALAERGVSTLLFDYRGFGDNPGRPNEEGLARDARTALAYLAGRRDVDPSRIVYFGESLGAAVALRLATERPPLALVLRSPFTSLADIGRYYFPYLPVRLLLREQYPSIDRARGFSGAVLVIVGDRDTVVPPEQSQRLYAAFREPKQLLVIEGAGHNDEVMFGPRVAGAVVDFVAQTALLGDIPAGARR